MAAFERNDTAQKVLDVIAQKLSRDKASLHEAMSLHELGADSLDMVEIVMRVEELFSIEVIDEDVEKFTSLKDIVDYVHAARNK